MPQSLIAAIESSLVTKSAEFPSVGDPLTASDPWAACASSCKSRARCDNPSKHCCIQPWQTSTKEQRGHTRSSPAWKRQERRKRQQSTRLERDDLLKFCGVSLAPRLQHTSKVRAEYVLVDSASSANMNVLTDQLNKLASQVAGLQSTMQHILDNSMPRQEITMHMDEL